ncbi:hypothetical protein LLH23_13735 [bacterium]|nr:hypothetical protein [bacterium]
MTNDGGDRPYAVQAAERWTQEQLEQQIDAHVSFAKVLLPVGDDNCEGVWVIILEGDQESGFGILDNRPFESGPTIPPAGAFVEYRTVDPDDKPYIVAWGIGE